jgi:hypothetical protein
MISGLILKIAEDMQERNVNNDSVSFAIKNNTVL